MGKFKEIATELEERKSKVDMYGYVLVSDFGDIICGNKEQVQFAYQAMLKYGIREDKIRIEVRTSTGFNMGQTRTGSFISKEQEDKLYGFCCETLYDYVDVHDCIEGGYDGIDSWTVEEMIEFAEEHIGEDSQADIRAIIQEYRAEEAIYCKLLAGEL